MAFAAIQWEISHYTTGGARYKVFHDGQLLLPSSREPFGDGARALLEVGGFDPDDTLVGYHGETPSLTARLAWAAAHTVTEGDRSGPRVVKWVANDAWDKNSDAAE